MWSPTSLLRRSANAVAPSPQPEYDQKRNSPIRLLLLDDNGLLRESLGRLLASEPDFEVMAGCGASREALGVLGGSSVHVVLLDLEVGAEHGNDFISAAREAGYQGRFLILTRMLDVRKSAIAVRLGASGIFLKSEAPARLMQAIRLVADGGIWLDEKIVQILVNQTITRGQLGEQAFRAVLADRERTVLRGIVGGLSNRKIGEDMGLTESCVKNIVQRLFNKAGVNTRSGLVRVALEGSLDAE